MILNRFYFSKQKLYCGLSCEQAIVISQLETIFSKSIIIDKDDFKRYII